MNGNMSEQRYWGPGISFESDRNVRLRDIDILDVNDGFRRDQQWRDWMTENLPERLRATLLIEDRDDIRFRFNRASSPPSVSCYAPAEMFFGDAKAAEVYRELRREIYVYVAKRSGWPEPPPVPAYHETKPPKKRKKRKAKHKS